MATNARQKRERRERVSARNRAETHKTGFDSSSLKLPPDTNLMTVDKTVKRLDILSYRAGKGNKHAEEGELYFERTYFTHRGIGPDSNTYVCPAKTAGKRCPVCDYRAKLLKDPDGDEQEIKDLRPKERQLFVAKDLDDPDRGYQVWDYSFHLFGKLLDTRVRESDEDEGFEFFADNEDGLTLKVTFEKKSFGGKDYYDAKVIDFKARKENYPASLADELPCLDDLLIIEPYDKLKAIFLQEPATPDEDDDSEDKPPVRPKRRPPADEDDDDWKDAQDRDADEDAPPPRKPKPRPPADEDDDDPPPRKPRPKAEEDEDDAPPPKPKAGKPKPKEDDWEDDFDDPPAKPKAGKGKPAPADDEDDDPPPKAGKPKPKPAADDDWDDEDEPPAKPAAKTGGKTKPKPADDDDWDD